MIEEENAMIENHNKQIADLETEYYTAKQNRPEIEISGNQAEVF